jgi:ligand-binding sensor domain-containing protein
MKVYTHDPEDTTSLSDNSVSCILELINGEMLIGTTGGGLNRFDPVTEKFRHYRHLPSDPGSISHDRITVIKADNDGQIWIGTQNGLNLFNPEKETFVVYKQETDIKNSVKDQILSLFHDRTGFFWIGTSNGLFRFERDKGEFNEVELVTPEYAGDSLSRIIHCIAQDHFGTLWIGTDNFIFTWENGQITWIGPQADRFEYPSNKFTNDIVELTSAGKTGLWIATHWGLNRYDFESSQFTGIFTEDQNSKGLSSSDITALYADENGLLWIAGMDGINMLDYSSNPFRHVVLDVGKYHHSAATFYEDKEGNFWIGSQNAGLLKYDSLLNFIARYNLELDHQVYVNYSGFKILEDSKGNLWIGMNLPCPGIYLFDRERAEFQKIPFQTFTSNQKPSEIRDILEASNGILWFGTNSGLYLYDPALAGVLSILPVDLEILSTSNISDIFQDQGGQLWIASNEGLFFCNTDNERIVTFTEVPENENSTGSLSGVPLCLSESSSGVIWVGTSEGLFKLNSGQKDFIEVMKQNELVGKNRIYSILEDSKGNFWMNTWKGLVRFNPGNTGGLSPRLYDISDGLPFEGLIPRSSLKSKDGRIFVPGIGSRSDGFYYFFPDSMITNTRLPPVMITDLKIRNEIYDAGCDISTTARLTLGWKRNYLSFEFVVLDYINPPKNQYAYRMEGLDDEWIHCGYRRYASYTDLSPGNYIFRVKGSNNDGLWNETGASISITILPPVWLTWWAYTLYAFFLAALIYAWRRYDLKRQRLRHALELEHVEAEKLKELDSLKSRFFANISHEFRTPLTLILGPLQNLLSRVSNETARQELSIMQRNARRLQNLINQLLDLSRLESGKMELKAGEANMVTLVRSYVQQFESLAKHKGITLEFSSEKDDIPAYVDKDKIEKILYNLLSNAFKWTGEGGRIGVNVLPTPVPPLSSGVVSKWLNHKGKRRIPQRYTKIYA